MKYGKKILTVVLTLLMILGAVAVMTVIAGAEEPAPALRIAYCNLSYKDNVYIKYAVKADNVADYHDVKILVWIDPQSDYVLGTQDYILEPLYTEKISGVSHIIYDFTQLAARQMTDVVYARAYTEADGEIYYSKLNKYSILQYAYNMLGKTAAGSNNAKLKQLLTDMLVYGASAQNYTDYKTDRLATMDFYQVVLMGGTLDDTCSHGLYLPGDKVVLNAPATDGDDKVFAFWKDMNGNVVVLNGNSELTVGITNNAYTPVYLDPTIEYSEGLEFTSNGDGTCYVSGIGTCTDTDVVIPYQSPAGDFVIAIGNWAFDNCNDLTSVTIPNSVTSFGSMIFACCTGLTSVTLPNGITSIGEGMFHACEALTSITIPESVTTIGSGAFNECFALTDIIIPQRVTSIGYSAFAFCRSLTSINIPEGVTVIEPQTFVYCEKLTSVTIPDGVTSIGSDAFRGCISLTSINIPESVTSIGYEAFLHCYSMTSIIIPEGVTSIEWASFSLCYGLTSVTLPAGITHIDANAFGACAALTDVYFAGSEEEWNEIVIASGNEYLQNATIHFSVKTYYKVTFVDHDGKVLKEISVVKGETATAPADPVREGFAFVGWDKSLENVTSDMTVTAVYRQTALPTLKADVVQVNQTAGTVDVAVSLQHNTGLSSLRFLVVYSDQLTLIHVSLANVNGAFMTAPEPFANPQPIMLISPLEDTDYSGTLAVLTFAISDTVEIGDVLSIELILDEVNIFDSEFNPVELDVVNGSVTVIE